MKFLAAIALVPLAIGPLPQDEQVLNVALCFGGSISIPIGDKDKDRKRDCHQQGCHAGNCREKPKRAKA